MKEREDNRFFVHKISDRSLMVLLHTTLVRRDIVGKDGITISCSQQTITSIVAPVTKVHIKVLLLQ